MPATTTIEVDLQAAEILRRATEAAKAQGQTLGAYLQVQLPSCATSVSAGRQRAAWSAFVAGMAEWPQAHPPTGHVVNDSRAATGADRE